MMKRIITGIILFMSFTAAIDAIPSPETPYKSFTLQETSYLAEAGFTETDANKWLDAFIRREVFDKGSEQKRAGIVTFLIKWKKGGLSLTQAREWDDMLTESVFFDAQPKVIKRLADAGVTTDTIAELSARQLVKLGKTVNELYAMQAKRIPLPQRLDLDALADWAAAGFSAEDAELFIESGKLPGGAAVPVSTARAWKASGFTVKETVGYYAVTRSSDIEQARRIKAAGIMPVEAAEQSRTIDNAKATGQAAPKIDPDNPGQHYYTLQPYFVYAQDKDQLQGFLSDLARYGDKDKLPLLGRINKGSVSYLKEPLKVQVLSLNEDKTFRGEELVCVQDITCGYTIWTIKRALK